MLRTVALSIAIMAFATSTATAASNPPSGHCQQAHKGIEFYTKATHKWQAALGVKKAKISSVRPIGCAYVKWVAKRWKKRAYTWRKKHEAAVIPHTTDWLTAVNLAQRIFPGTSRWLLDCSSSEGGWGRWVPNGDGSGAGGWMQFLSGTFYGNVDAAFSTARRLGFRIAPEARSWYSATGQAITAAYMLGIGQRGQWYGSRC